MNIQLAYNSVPSEPLIIPPALDSVRLVTPGQCINDDASYMRGHGTYMEDGRQIASVSGVVTQVNRLVTVNPLRQIYQGAVGDTIVGRVTGVGGGRWHMDVNSFLEGELRLANVQLPSGEQRRTNLEDERCMRDLICEGSLVCVEVQKIESNGVLRLAARNSNFGKLGQGILASVPSSLVVQDKQRMRDLPCGVHVIFSANGYVFVSPPRTDKEVAVTSYSLSEEEVTPDIRENIARVYNIVRALAKHSVMLSSHSVMIAFDVSSKMQVSELLKANVQRDLALQTLQTIADDRG